MVSLASTTKQFLSELDFLTFSPLFFNSAAAENPYLLTQGARFFPAVMEAFQMPVHHGPSSSLSICIPSPVAEQPLHLHLFLPSSPLCVPNDASSRPPLISEKSSW